MTANKQRQTFQQMHEMLRASRSVDFDMDVGRALAREMLAELKTADTAYDRPHVGAIVRRYVDTVAKKQNGALTQGFCAVVEDLLASALESGQAAVSVHE